MSNYKNTIDADFEKDWVLLLYFFIEVDFDFQAHGLFLCKPSWIFKITNIAIFLIFEYYTYLPLCSCRNFTFDFRP